jgi:hypothetical protein
MADHISTKLTKLHERKVREHYQAKYFREVKGAPITMSITCKRDTNNYEHYL